MQPEGGIGSQRLHGVGKIYRDALQRGIVASGRKKA
jgi:hypothetical protein